MLTQYILVTIKPDIIPGENLAKISVTDVFANSQVGFNSTIISVDDSMYMIFTYLIHNLRILVAMIRLGQTVHIRLHK